MADDGFALRSEVPGAIMAHYCVQFRTMAQLCGATAHTTIPSLLALLARSAELAHIHIRCVAAAGTACLNTVLRETAYARSCEAAYCMQLHRAAGSSCGRSPKC